MVLYSNPSLDLSFAALSDATRRGIIDQLARGEASITRLADKFQMTLTGMKKHVQVLERAGLVVTEKVGRVRTCKLGKRGLKAEAEWIEAHRKLFEARFEALDEIIGELNQQGSSAGGARNHTSVERRGDRELVVTRTFDAPPSTVYRAWSQPELFLRWWMPKSVSGVSLVSCEMDVRTGGKYRLEFGASGSDTMAFYGKYLEVVPNARIVWTNDEGEEGAVTTVTFEDRDGKTLLTFSEVYPSAEALEEALQGSAAALPEQFEQLDELLSGVGE